MSDVAGKWGIEVAQRGFTQIPNYLLLINQFLDQPHRLSPVELLIVLQLVGSWWKKDELPFPSMKTLARRCGVSERQVQRSVNSLVQKGFLARTKRRGERGIIASNAYNLQPLVAVLGVIAKAFPNEYPRKVSDETRRAISAALASETSSSDDTDTEAVEGLGTSEPS